MMWNGSELIVAFILSTVTSFLATPLIIRLAKKIGAVDQPDSNRKLHTEVKPTLGGLAIFLGVMVGFLYLQPVHPQMYAIFIGAFIMIIVGLLDDLVELRPLYKLIGQISAAIIVAQSGLVIDKLTIPFMGTVTLKGVGILLTILWIVAASNVINIIDGLDGLAAGVSTIALLSILIMGFMDARFIVVALSILLIGSNLGFLPYNFYPSKIFMGDTGSLFLGYSIGIISMLGLFKNVAFFSFVIPIIVIAVPVIDTVLVMIRRRLNNQSIAEADRKHIHYELMNMGYSHRASVLIIYGFSIYFGILAILFNSGTLLTSLLILFASIFGIKLIMEMAGIEGVHRALFRGKIRNINTRRDRYYR